MREFEKLIATLGPGDVEETARELLEKLGLGIRQSGRATAVASAQPAAEMKGAGGGVGDTSGAAGAGAFSFLKATGAGLPALSNESAEGEMPSPKAETQEREMPRRGFTEAETSSGWQSQSRVQLPFGASAGFAEGEVIRTGGVYSAVTADAGVAGENAAGQGDKAVSMRAFSDFFKRDSRRYDKGFQRY